MTYPYPEGPLRDAWRRGASDEARVRREALEAAGKPARDVLELVHSIVEHHKPQTALEVLAPVLRIYGAGLDAEDREELHRALRARRPRWRPRWHL